MKPEDELLEILAEKRALTGKELRDLSGLEELALWRLCHTSADICTRITGRRYLRLDRIVQGYARLSPSIKREFLTYTVCGPAEEGEGAVEARALSLEEETRRISRKKHDFAVETFAKIVSASGHEDEVLSHACFIIGGDIVFDMAHEEPRPEQSTGRLVRGSDLDIIIVTDGGLEDAVVEALDAAVYREKYLCLIKPEIREEIDYIIKDLDKVRWQLAFDSFEHMIAAKILWEGEFLCGSRPLFDRIKAMLDEFAIPEKIEALVDRAQRNREEAWSFLLTGTGALSEEESIKLFYTREEREEIF